MASDKWLTSRRWHIGAVFISLFAGFLILKLYQFLSFQTLFEPADYELVLWNTLHGNFLQLPGGHIFFSEHFSPILLIILPLYALAQSPYTLIVIQAVACSAAVVPLYFLTCRFTSSRWPPLALSLAYGVSTIVTNGLMYDFHPETLYPVLFFGAFLAFETKHWKLFFVLLVLAMMVKEDAAIAVVGLGLFVFFAGYRKRGMITTLTGLIGVLAVVLLVIPLVRGESIGHEYKFAGHWDGYGSTQGEILLNFLNPLNHFRVIFTASKLVRMNILFSGFLFLPFLSFRGLLFLILPTWFVLYSSDYWLMNGPFLYYGMILAPFLFYGSLLGTENIARKWPLRRDTIFLWAATLILLVQTGQSTIFKQFLQVGRHLPERYAITAHEIIASIPPGAGVAAQSHLVPHVPPRACRTCFPFDLDKVDYIFLDLHGNTWPLLARQYSATVDTLRRSQAWAIRIERDGFILLERRSVNVQTKEGREMAPDTGEVTDLRETAVETNPKVARYENRYWRVPYSTRASLLKSLPFH